MSNSQTTSRPRRVVVLGSTGSLGRQALEVIEALPELLEVVGLAAGGNVGLLAQQVQRYRPRFVCHSAGALSLSQLDHAMQSTGAKLLPMAEMSSHPDVDLVLITTAGKAGLAPTFAAIRARKLVALANKEVLVMAGDLVMAEARRYGVTVMPVDSEHSAIWQCLRGESNGLTVDPQSGVRRLLLTASGGAFRDRTREQLAQVTPAEALQHPTWLMGKKITIDSATLMNKGLEIIEAHHLFGMSYDSIDVVLHHQSIVHSLVEFVDGSMKAQLGTPDMRLPIQYALTYPQRQANPWPRLDLAVVSQLTFAEVDFGRYPCLRLALRAAHHGGTYPVVLNAADEEAVEAFLNGNIDFITISEVIERVMDAHAGSTHPTLEELLEVDTWARACAYQTIKALSGQAHRLH